MAEERFCSYEDVWRYMLFDQISRKTEERQRKKKEKEEELQSLGRKIDGMSGLEFEDFCADLLEKNGYRNVRKTKTSGDQGLDLLATRDGVTFGFQCKCYNKDLDNTPIQEALAGKYVYRCHVVIVMTNRYFSKGACEAAKATGVVLWNRAKLLEFAGRAAEKAGEFPG